ncbi:MAG: CoA transferase [Marinosulfonomonas sp.]|nr:CoA transferase [Marinosulfonomonas sp.]
MSQINTRPATEYLAAISVVEIGSRISVGVCGSLLAEAGADVFFVEPRKTATSNKWENRKLYASGKHAILADPDDKSDVEMLTRLIQTADVVLVSGDVDPAAWQSIVDDCQEAAIVCDFTAFGKDGPLAGKPYDDALVQAMSGVAHTTGFADGPPVTLQVPLLEYSTGTYGAAAIVAALSARDQTGHNQTIDMALYDAGVNSLATFLPAHFGGKAPMRVGNQHAMCAPWNAFQASDGWLLLCSASNPPWQRLCNVMGVPQFGDDPKYADLPGRMENRDEVNQIVQDWVGRHSVTQAVEILMAADIACGPILRMEDGDQDPNLRHRSMIRHVPDHSETGDMRIPGAILKAVTGDGRVPDHIPDRDEACALAKDFIAKKPDFKADGQGGGDLALPLQGIRVLEIGQYTTAPLSTKHLATLGAEVIKIEPPTGDAAREWLPHNGDLSYFFVMSNAGKTSIAVDLQSDEGQEIFTKLLESADIFLENLKPGSLARRGFDWQKMSSINPRLIYCAISGFGADSAYEERPAFDTVVQAMAGLMNANSWDGTPLKAGVSACDFMGGEVGLFFVLAALRNRERTGKGDYLDLSMQDIAVWMTASLWNDEPDAVRQNQMLECTDGYVCVAGAPDDLRAKIPQDQWKDLTRVQAIEQLTIAGLIAVPVQSIADMLDHPQTKARSLMQMHDGPDGLHWPLIGSPMVFSNLKLAIGDVIGQPQPVDADMRARLKIDR